MLFRSMHRLMRNLTERPILLRPPVGLERLRTRLLVFGFWGLLGFTETSKEMLTARMQGISRPVSDAIVVNFPWWFFWVFGTLIAIEAARRWPLDANRRFGAVALHALVATLIALFHLTLVAVLIHFAVSRGGETAGSSFDAQLRFWIQGYLVLDFFVYWMVLGGYHALLYHRRYAEGRAREAEARLHALQMELQPHFLYNALNAIAGLVEERRDGEATTMLARLGELLRITLRRGYEREVELDEELDYIERYLAIEQVRFGSRLGVEVVADADARSAAVPPMILQPLVENAVRHGVARTPGPTLVEISASCDGHTLRVKVRDSGPGPMPSAGHGTGLSNVTSRLETFYGRNGTLTVEPQPGGGCIAEIRLPYHTLTMTCPATNGGPG